MICITSVAGLQETKQKDRSFFEMYYASNKTIYAKFCGNLNELRLFIAGKLNGGMTNVFEESYCDEESLDVLSRLGISTDRSMTVKSKYAIVYAQCVSDDTCIDVAKTALNCL